MRFRLSFANVSLAHGGRARERVQGWAKLESALENVFQVFLQPFVGEHLDYNHFTSPEGYENATMSTGFDQGRLQ